LDRGRHRHGVDDDRSDHADGVCRGAVGRGPAPDTVPRPGGGQRPRIHGGEGELEADQRLRLSLSGPPGRGVRGHPSADDLDQGGRLMPPPGRIRDLGLELLDRQIVDRDGMLAGKVDDLELSFPEGGSGPPFVTAILAGPGALARRLGGRLGWWVESTYARLAEDPTPSRISFGVVKRIGT